MLTINWLTCTHNLLFHPSWVLVEQTSKIAITVEADSFGHGKGSKNMFKLGQKGHENEMTRESVGLVRFGLRVGCVEHVWTCEPGGGSRS
ncbi:hypothetical protein NC651_000746 [Populus alba x Populus x berolinensis]|nr:hypothetical protein NC651_000746 [Populus alba x Populus x berolinensis]